MTTVTAKQLRENLSEYLDRMEAGEEIAVIRHSEVIGKLLPQTQTSQYTGSANAKKLAKLTPKLKKHPIFSDPTVAYKELRDELMLNDPKYVGK